MDQIFHTRGSATKVACETFEVRFDDFAALPATKGQDVVNSPEFTCFGHRWRLNLWPGGLSGLIADGKVSVYLHHCSPGNIEVHSTFVVDATKRGECCACTSGSWFAEGVDDNYGNSEFADRTKILDSLQNGALVIEVRMKQIEYVPPNPLLKNILKKFMDEESSDVVFEVSGSDEVEEGEREKRKRAKSSPTTFHAHRFVLQDNAPALAEACESSSDLTPIPIAGIKPEIFRHVLYYVYGGGVDAEALKQNARDIIDAADRLGVASLKLEAEVYYFENACQTDITIGNAIDYLLYADAKNCPLLKEAVMDFIVENGDDAEQLSFDNVPGGLMKDLLIAMNRGKRRDLGEHSGNELRTMRISELRRKLDEKGLDVDGSREAMIAALEEHS